VLKPNNNVKQNQKKTGRELLDSIAKNRQQIITHKINKNYYQLNELSGQISTTIHNALNSIDTEPILKNTIEEGK